MTRNHNMPVREAAARHDFYLWEVADFMGLSYSALMQRMRREWPVDEQLRVIQLIEKNASKMNDEGKFPVMLSVPKAAEVSHLPQHLLRQLCKDGKVKHIRTGNKFLINSNSLIDYLNEGDPAHD